MHVQMHLTVLLGHFQSERSKVAKVRMASSPRTALSLERKEHFRCVGGLGVGANPAYRAIGFPSLAPTDQLQKAFYIALQPWISITSFKPVAKCKNRNSRISLTISLISRITKSLSQYAVA